MRLTPKCYIFRHCISLYVKPSSFHLLSFTCTMSPFISYIMCALLSPFIPSSKISSYVCILCLYYPSCVSIVLIKLLEDDTGHDLFSSVQRQGAKVKFWNPKPARKHLTMETGPETRGCTLNIKKSMGSLWPLWVLCLGSC